MPSPQYPTALVTTSDLPNTRTDGTLTTVNHPNDHNRLANEVIAVEAELGTNPSGSYINVAGRLDAIDTVIYGTDHKTSVRASSVSNITVASPGNSIDGVTLATNDRVLLKDQSTASENGIWIWNGLAIPMTRATDADSGIKVTSGMNVYVESGSINQKTFWVLTTTGAITVGTTSLTFEDKFLYNTSTAGGDLSGAFSALTIANNAITTSKISDLAVTIGKIASSALLIGSATSSTSFSQSPAVSGTFYDLTGVTITVTGNNRPVLVIAHMPNIAFSSTGSYSSHRVAIRDGSNTQLRTTHMVNSALLTAPQTIMYLAPAFSGSQTFKVSAQINSSGTNTIVSGSGSSNFTTGTIIAVQL